MKLNKKGFVSSAVMYSLLLLFLALILGLMALLSNRKQILDKLKGDIKSEVNQTKQYDLYENGTAIYYNPITDKLCSDYTEENSLNENKTGCLKWYIFNDNKDKATVNMILDHNTTATSAWVSLDDYKDAGGTEEEYGSNGNNSKGPITLNKEIAKLNDESNWKVTPRLISADEIADITNNINWKSTEDSSYFMFDSNTTTASETCTTGNITGCNYGWLYDRVNINCETYGCFNNSDIEINGYWTSTKNIASDKTSYAWNVGYAGSLGNANGGGIVSTNAKYGVRPVISISKKYIKNYMIPTLVNIKNGIVNADGSSSEPYYIKTVEDLVVMASEVNSNNDYSNKNIILMNNIDFNNKNNYLDYTSKYYGDINGDGIKDTIFNELTSSNGFMPIGTADKSFNGTFDGKNKRIINLLINRTDTYQGLFGNNSGTIKNLSINGNVSGTYRVGTLTAKNTGKINNIENNAIVKLNLIANYAAGDTTYFSGYVGGIVGYNKGTITNSINNGNITLTYNSNSDDNGYIGGILGYNDGGTVSKSINSGTITGASTRDTITGGVVGANYNSGTVVDTYNNGKIISSSTDSVSYSGGVVGLNRGNLSNSYNIGKIPNVGSQNKCLTYNDTSRNGKVTNSYYIESCTLGGEGTIKTSTELKSLTSTLGSSYEDDIYGINNSYPILTWQKDGLGVIKINDNILPLKYESDGSIWAKVFFHDNVGGTVLFTDEEEAQLTSQINKVSSLKYLNTFKNNDGKFEFILRYPNDTDKYNRWIQTSNPTEEKIPNGTGEETATGYTPIHIASSSNYWGGLTLSTSPNNYIDGSVGSSDWYYSIGTYKSFKNGIPTSIHFHGTTDYSTGNVVELWVRIDDYLNK